MSRARNLRRRLQRRLARDPYAVGFYVQIPEADGGLAAIDAMVRDAGIDADAASVPLAMTHLLRHALLTGAEPGDHVFIAWRDLERTAGMLP